MFAFKDTRGPVEVAFTDRHGGVSGGPYASLDLADREDRPDEVAENLRRVVHAFTREEGSPRVVRMRQMHGIDVHIVTPEPGEPPQADGLVSDLSGVVLMVRVADCVPVLLADPELGLIGVAHAGRMGLLGGIVPETVRTLRGLGAGAIVGWVGPHVCGSCYEVPEEMRAQVSQVVPVAASSTSWDTPSLDLGAGVRAQLEAAGVDVVDASRCTREDDDLYSYRRQGTESGRLAGLIWVHP